MKRKPPSQTTDSGKLIVLRAMHGFIVLLFLNFNKIVLFVIIKGVAWLCRGLRLLKLLVCERETLFAHFVFDGWHNRIRTHRAAPQT
jgi:hypothetical protein